MASERSKPEDKGSRTAFECLDGMPAPEIVDEARALLLEYGKFVLAEAGAARFCFGTLEAEARALPFSYLDKSGGVLMARVDGLPAGIVCWRGLLATEVVPERSWEMKRLWVRPEFRGFNLGRRLTERVIDRARAAGVGAIFLDTVPASMGNAFRLYESLGFSECAPYNQSPIEGITWMKLAL